MWCFEFLESDGSICDHRLTKGVWLIRLALAEHSPPTFVDSRLIIEDARPLARSSKPAPPSEPPEASTQSIPGRLSLNIEPTGSSSQKPKPSIEIRIKTPSQQLVAPFKGWNRSNEPLGLKDISEPLSKSLMGNSLQFECVEST